MTIEIEDLLEASSLANRQVFSVLTTWDEACTFFNKAPDLCQAFFIEIEERSLRIERPEPAQVQRSGKRSLWQDGVHSGRLLMLAGSRNLLGVPTSRHAEKDNLGTEGFPH